MNNINIFIFYNINQLFEQEPVLEDSHFEFS